MVVKAELEKFGLHPTTVDLGEADIPKEISESKKQEIDTALQHYGFALIDSRKSQVIEKIKNVIVELVHSQNNKLKTNLSDFLTSQLPYEYNYISNLFAQVEGTTIEQYYIAQKIERVKELLVYDELTINQIADQLNYSSAAHLSSQFKKVTGLTASHFKQLKDNKRKPLEEL